MTQSETIREITQRYVAALNKPGASGAGEFFAEEADLLPPGPDNLKGRAAIQAFWAAAAEQFSDVELRTEHVADIGPGAAQEIGTYRARVRGKQEGDVSGKYVFIWRKIDGEWKISTDIWTSHRSET